LADQINSKHETKGSTQAPRQDIRKKKQNPIDDDRVTSRVKKSQNAHIDKTQLIISWNQRIIIIDPPSMAFDRCLKSVVFEVSSHESIAKCIFEKSSFNVLPSVIISLILPSLTE